MMQSLAEVEMWGRNQTSLGTATNLQQKINICHGISEKNVRNKKKQNLEFKSKGVLKEKKIQLKHFSNLLLCHFLQ